MNIQGHVINETNISKTNVKKQISVLFVIYKFSFYFKVLRTYILKHKKRQCKLNNKKIHKNS